MVDISFILGIILGSAVTIVQAPRLYKKGIDKGKKIGFKEGQRVGVAKGKSDALVKFNDMMASSRMYFMSDM